MADRHPRGDDERWGWIETGDARLYPEAGCEYGKSDVAMTESLDVCAGGQMGKML